MRKFGNEIEIMKLHETAENSLMQSSVFSLVYQGPG